MSTNLHWEPVAPRGHRLPKGLKFAFEKRWPEGIDRRELTAQADTGYVEALRDQGVEGAQALLDILHEFSVIEIWVE